MKTKIKAKIISDFLKWENKKFDSLEASTRSIPYRIRRYFKPNTVTIIKTPHIVKRLFRKGCNHILKRLKNNYSGTLLQRDTRSKNIYICHECWNAFLVNFKTNKVILLSNKK